MLNMDFDHYTGESFYRDKTAAVVEELKEKNLLKESEGAMIVDLDEYDMAPCLVMKKDGSSIYATRDLAAIFYRKKEYNFDKCIYVTGLEQKLHFAQVFKVVELMGYEWAKENLIHVPYGLVSLEGGKLSTRSGNIVYAEDILKESVSKIREIIAEQTGKDESEITLETNVKEDLDADSLDLFQIINDIEDEFDVSVENPEEIVTVKDAVDFVESHK